MKATETTDTELITDLSKSSTTQADQTDGNRETFISYDDLRNIRQRVANKRFKQELVLIEIGVAKQIYDITPSFSVVSREQTEQKVRIFNDETSSRQDFRNQMKSAAGLGAFPDLVLDSVEYRSGWYILRKFEYDQGDSREISSLQVDAVTPSLCWVCNRIFVFKHVAYKSLSGWESNGWILKRVPIWCSQACRTKVSSFRLAQTRKAQRREKDRSTICLDCGKTFESKRSGATFCSPLCRLRHHRKQNGSK